MSYVSTAPEALAAASGELSGIGLAIQRAAAVAASPTTGIAAAAGDEVSAAVAGLFGSYADEFQALTARTTLFGAEFERALRAAGVAYGAAEAANVSPLLIGGTTTTNTGRATLGAVLNWATNAVGLGRVLNFASTVAVSGTNGVSGVRIGFSLLRIPVSGTFLGLPFGYEYPAPALWYFPTQADGGVNATGTVYLQHGFGGTGQAYQPLSIELARQTNSVVVAPTIPSVPSPFGLWLNSPEMHRGVGSLFLGSQPALNLSADQAGYQGTLPQDFVLTGHSAGGGLATIAAGNYLSALGGGTNHLRGVVMFDGVAANPTAFGNAIATLQAANIGVYTVAAAPQMWNGFAATAHQLAGLYSNQFSGVEIVGGSHMDAILGGSPLVGWVLQAATRFSPPGATAAVYTLATGWINDMYTPGAGPLAPVYGVYGPTGMYLPPGGQQITLGQATGIVLH